MHFVIGTVGTRGDVQPYVAIGKGLVRAGHRVTVATHRDFETLCTSRGLGFRPIEPSARSLSESELGRQWMESGANVVRYTRLARQVFGEAQRTWTHGFVRAMHDADALVFYPMAFGALLAAEQRRIPIVAAAPWPATPSGELAHPLMASVDRLPLRWLNRVSHRVADAIFSLPFYAQHNSMRRELGLGPLRTRRIFQHNSDLRLPTLHLFSPAVLPRMPDWPDEVAVTGYAFLDDDEWQPSDELVRFLERDEPPLAIGFGSMMSQSPERLGRAVNDALRRTDQRAVFIGGWSKNDLTLDPERALVVEDVPHGWLFPRCSAVVHHGGAGTTGASLRAGKPSVIVSFFGDQPFWGRRVHTLGAGPTALVSRELTGQALAERISQALSDEHMRARAATLGHLISAETGVERAVKLIERHCGA